VDVEAMTLLPRSWIMYSLSILGAVSRDRSSALPHCADHALDRCAHQPGLVELDVVAAARRDDLLRARHEMRELVLNGAPCLPEDGREVGREPGGKLERLDVREHDDGEPPQRAGRLGLAHLGEARIKR